MSKKSPPVTTPVAVMEVAAVMAPEAIDMVPSVMVPEAVTPTPAVQEVQRNDCFPLASILFFYNILSQVCLFTYVLLVLFCLCVRCVCSLQWTAFADQGVSCRELD